MTAVRRVPFGCGDIRREVPHPEASDVAADLLSIDHRGVPRPIVAYRAFHGKFVGVSVYYDKNKLALCHRGAPEAKIFFPSPLSAVEPSRTTIGLPTGA